MNEPDVTLKWIAAGKALAIDPGQAILCPVHEDATLVVEDIPIEGTHKFERIMRCPKCGSQNILLLTRTD